MHSTGLPVDQKALEVAAETDCINAELDSPLEALLAQLPQTQCRQCGFDGCRPYAQAILDGRSDINQCPPGGQAGVDRLASHLGRESKTLNLAHGIEAERVVAIIREDICIGCTLCIQACPVDAIVGAAKQMHTVIADRCTGCRLCVAPCPMDCIDLPVVMLGQTGWQAWSQEEADLAREHFEVRERRLGRMPPAHETSKPSTLTPSVTTKGLQQSLVQKALQAAKNRHVKQ